MIHILFVMTWLIRSLATQIFLKPVLPSIKLGGGGIFIFPINPWNK